MKVIIPDDWDGETWDCYKVRWPASARWLALLHGLLTTPTRGRWYEESTGSIKAAQLVGMQIFDNNIPLIPCEDCEDENGEDDQRDRLIEAMQCAGIVIEGESNMGQVVTDVTVEDGYLKVWFGKCCVQSFPLTALQPGGDVPTEDVPQPGDVDYPEYPETWDAGTACSKATILADTLVAVVDELLDAAEVPETPTKALRLVKARVPGVNFGNLSIYTAYAAAGVVRAAGMASEAEDPQVLVDLYCKLAAAIAPGNQGVDTGAEYDDCTAAIKSVLGDHFNLYTYPTTFGSIQTLYVNAWLAIGKGDTQALTTNAFPTGAEDCDCDQYAQDPQGATEPNEGGYYLSRNFFANVAASQVVSADNPDWYIYHPRATTEHKAYGWYLKMWYKLGGVVKRMGPTGKPEVPPPYDVALTGDTSDHLEALKDAAGRIRIYVGYNHDGTLYASIPVMTGEAAPTTYLSGVFDSIGDVQLANKVMLARIHADVDTVASNLIVEDFRFMYKINDDSH